MLLATHCDYSVDVVAVSIVTGGYNASAINPTSAAGYYSTATTIAFVVVVTGVDLSSAAAVVKSCPSSSRSQDVVVLFT